MPMPTTDASRTHAASTEQIFVIQVGENDVIEVRISIASVPLLNPPPRPRRFELVHPLESGSRFVIRGELDEARAAPLLNPPTRPNEN